MKNKKELFILVGCPGLGKSTFIKEHLPYFNGYSKVVSRDQIRFSMVNEDEEYFSKENDVFNKYIEEIKDGLEYCDSTIADATHLNPASRNKLLRALGNSLKGVEVNAIVIRGTLDLALAQNRKRVGTRSFVPESAVKRMFTQQIEPSFEEGFRKIYIYDNSKDVKLMIIEKEA